MIKRKFLLIFTIVMLVFPVVSAYAASGVYDDAGLFYETETYTLKTEIEELSTLTGWDIAVVTTDDAEGMTSVAYADSCFEKYSLGANGIIYLLDMDNREIYISTSGAATSYLTDGRLDLIFDSAADYAAQQSYYQAMSVQLEMTEQFFNEGIPVNKEEAAAKVASFISALIIGLLGAGFFAFKIHKIYTFKKPVEIYDYNKNGRADISLKTDKLIDSYVTSEIKQKNKKTSSSGRGRRR